MKKQFLFIALMMITGLSALFSQTPEQYSSVRILLSGKSMADLVKTGIETEHGQYYPGRSITVVLSSDELARVQQAGFETEVLIADLRKFYLEQKSHSNATEERNGDCEPSIPDFLKYETPANYTYGTMGGYFTYSQMMAELDKMHALYPNLISQRRVSSDTIVTWEGLQIYNVKISDNADVDEPERQVLYTALHHAREPNSASQLIFFMWYLLENYNTRPDIKALVDNLEMYFIPCINVDGYLYNEQTDPGGGGFWRKNRRDNGNGTYGIDLNRNYGYFWGDLGGSSGLPSSEIYRGPEAFSEPETRTVRDFVRAHDFLFVYNYHTSGNLFIYPWAYSDELADSALYRYARFFTRESNYHFGTTTETVGYQVNGSSDDWIFAETGAYSFTPEIGNTGFWPAFDEIDKFNKANMWHNYSMACSALRYGVAHDLSLTQLPDLSGTLPVAFTRYGLLDGPITVTLTPFSSNISSGPESKVFDLDNLATENYNFPYALNANTAAGEELIFLLKTDNGFWVKTDTLRKRYAEISSIVAFQDQLNNTANWSGDWATTNSTFYSAPTCITDSPNGNYGSNAASTCQLANPITIPANAESVNLRFFAKWALENDWDYVQLRAILPDGTAVPLCGLFTNTGANVQPLEPVYDGDRLDWVEECINLNAFAGQTIKLEFELVSDGFQEEDGFYFDDVKVEYLLPGSGVQSLSFRDFVVRQNEPNPAKSETVIRWQNNGAMQGAAEFMVFNVLGETILSQKIDMDSQQHIVLDTHTLAPGVYSYCIRNGSGQSAPLKMTIAR